mmetsp:Transcript_19656/g.54881  ORF Transcript_19656/g.54881 Transcript_19656/m.54881 type:complete len:312 (+) Transcript_19656:2703-3638(+)
MLGCHGTHSVARKLHPIIVDGVSFAEARDPFSRTQTHFDPAQGIARETPPISSLVFRQGFFDTGHDDHETQKGNKGSHQVGQHKGILLQELSADHLRPGLVVVVVPEPSGVLPYGLRKQTPDRGTDQHPVPGHGGHHRDAPGFEFRVPVSNFCNGRPCHDHGPVQNPVDESDRHRPRIGGRQPKEDVSHDHCHESDDEGKPSPVHVGAISPGNRGRDAPETKGAGEDSSVRTNGCRRVVQRRRRVLVSAIQQVEGHESRVWEHIHDQEKHAKGTPTKSNSRPKVATVAQSLFSLAHVIGVGVVVVSNHRRR